MKICRFFLSITLLLSIAPAGQSVEQLVPKLSLQKAVEVLNSSPWARHETFTRVISGVGSGVAGEKEIFDTFYVRFLSARPIRDAFARIQELQYGYDTLAEQDKVRLASMIQPGVQLDVRNWIVVAVSFRSNDPNEESTARRFFQKETTETLRNKAFLVSEQFPQIQIAAYFPPRDEGVGAKFVFPRILNGVPVVSKTCRKVTFELLEVPGASPRLRASFSVKDMLINGEVVI
jgi:hypothetical protein